MNDLIKWVNREIINIGGNKINQEDVESIATFTILWSLFENICCEKEAYMNKIYKNIEDKLDSFEEEDYKGIFEYFYKRYKDRQRFNALNLKGNQKEFIKKILNSKSNDITKEEKLKFIMIVIYRYRNNFFHGEKNMRYIRFQRNNFNIANNFLKTFIEKFKEENR